MIILGISAYFHDSSACIIKNGEIISAIHEERITRIKHDNSFPSNAINGCLKIAACDLNDVDYVIFFEKPFLKFERIVEIATRTAPFSWRQFFTSMPMWIKHKLFQKKIITTELKKIDSTFTDEKLKFSDHHLSHASSAFFPSPFKEALVLTMDGVGEWATTTLSYGKDNQLDLIKEIRFPHSLGLLYSTFTYFCGFKVNSGEYKLMGLAPYGNPRYVDKIKEELIDIKSDGSFKLNMRYFTFLNNLEMCGKRFEKLFEIKRISSESSITQDYMDLAASVQVVLEEIIIKIVKAIKNDFPLVKNLCLAGGVALNCVSNAKIIEKKIFDDVWVQPASGDAGGSLGAALAFYYCSMNKRRIVLEDDSMNNSYLGRQYTDAQIKSLLDKEHWEYQVFDKDNDMAHEIAGLLKDGKVIGRFVGKEEFGPRALGNRSILANPMITDMQNRLNMKIKFREGFRPFAPVVKFDKASEWFQIEKESKYMLFTYDVNESKRNNQVCENEDGFKRLKIHRSKIQAATHVDYSSRVQTIKEVDNAKLYQLLSTFEKLTGCPVLINTSFNVRGEPIVGSPSDALFCFMATEMDALQIESFLLIKEKQNKDKSRQYSKSIHLND